MIATLENLNTKIKDLPDNYLDELAEFIDYLFWKHQSAKESVEMLPIEDDPIVGLFAGEPNLAEKSEEILDQEITNISGWTWKQSQA
jgi:hypothetical protein